MTKQKKSFLDRIISSEKEEKKQSGGDVILEDSERSEENIISEIEAIKKIEEENDFRKTIDIEKEEDKGEKELVKRNENNSINNGNSDGEEGQLTIDVYQNGDFIIIKSIIGGAKSADLDISITNDMVTIRGARENPDKIAAENYYYQECFWGNFSRSVILPCDIKTDKVKATMKNGVLTIKLAKIEKNSSIKIKIEEE